MEQEATTKTVETLRNYSLNNPTELMHLAVEASKFIKEHKLTTRIGDKDYVEVEGWQYILARLGIFPRISWTKCLNGTDNKNNNQECKYEARALLIDSNNGKVIGSGTAVCSSLESKKKSFDEYAISSMAQTRSVGKAARVLIAWIVRAAGYEPTPLEEIQTLDGDGNVLTSEPVKAQPDYKKGASDDVKQKIQDILNLGLLNPAVLKSASNDLANPKLSQEKANSLLANLEKMMENKKPAAAAATKAPAQEATATKPAGVVAPANKPEAPTPTGAEVNGTPTPETEEDKEAKSKAKADLIKLLNSPLILREEKTKMLVNINKIPLERLLESITKIQQVIKRRQEEADNTDH